MTLYEFKVNVCRVAYDLNVKKAWKIFDEFVTRYGANLMYDAMLFDDFYVAVCKDVEKSKFYDVMDMLFNRLRRADLIEFMHQVTGSREYHTLLDDMANNRVVGA